jgi:hypothetical protein
MDTQRMAALAGTRVARSVIVPVASGMLSAQFAYLLGMPGDGTFVWVTSLLGAVAGITAANWWGYLLTLAGCVAGIVLMVLLGNVGGLVLLVSAVLGYLLGVGYLIGWLTWRFVADRGTAFRDRRVPIALVVVVVLAIGAWWMAQEFARNPP